MKPLYTAILNLLHDWDNFCRLCFNSIGSEEESFRMQDEVITKLQFPEKTEEVSSILATVLGYEVMDNVLPNDRVCDECFKLALNSYIFIETSREKSHSLSYTIECINTCLENPEPIDKYKSLFVHINIQQTSCTTYFDYIKCNTKTAALKQFKNSAKPQPQRVRAKMKNCLITTEDDFKASMDMEFTDTKFLPVPIEIYSILQLEDGSKRYYCKFCDKECNRLNNITRHFHNCHERSPRHIIRNEPKHDSWVCHSCGKVCKDKTALRQHEKIHTKEIQCPDCKKCYKNNHYFAQHLCVPNVGERPKLDKNFICDQCGAKFGRKSSLLLHIKFEHGDGVPHICSFCNKKFYAASALKTHLVTHTKEKDFKCETCDGRFVSKESLMYHVRTHTGEKPFKCKFCEKHFLSTSRRADHVRIHHLAPSLPCDMCNKRFKTHGHVNKHKKLHFDPKSSLYIIPQDLYAPPSLFNSYT